MIELAQYQDIRKLYKDEGLSERAIAKRLGISRNTVAKYKDGGVIPGQREPLKRKSPVTGPIKDIVAGYLLEDQGESSKQRHTA